MKSLRSIFTLVLFLIFSTAAHAQEKQDLRQYNLTLNGQPAGNAKSYTIKNKQGNFESHMRMKIAMARGPVTIKITTHTIYEETPKHQTVKLISKQIQDVLGNTTNTTKTYVFHKDSVTLTTITDNQKPTKSTLALPDHQTITTPLASQALFEKAIKNNQKTFTVTSLSPETGTTALSITTTLEGKEKITISDKAIEAYKSLVSSSIMPSVKITNYTDVKGTPYITNMPMGPFNIKLVQTSELNQNLEPAQMLVNTFVKPAKAIKNPRKLKKAIYKVTLDHPKGAKPSNINFPRAGAQRAIWADQKTLMVYVDTTKSVNPKDDLPTPKNLEHSTMITIDDPAVVKLHQLATIKEIHMNHQARAVDLKNFVHKTIKQKNLSSANATAAQVAKSKSGDCTEHAVLLAALLRRSKIPSRTVSGLVYADQFAGARDIFGYHMWTQAWIDDDKQGGRWVDLDATIPTKFDATHIAISTSDQSDENAVQQDALKLLPIIGKIKIQTVQAEYK